MYFYTKKRLNITYKKTQQKNNTKHVKGFLCSSPVEETPKKM